MKNNYLVYNDQIITIKIIAINFSKKLQTYLNFKQIW